MQTQEQSNQQRTQSLSGGGRVSSAALRYARAISDGFTGLEEGADRYQLLLLVKKAGKLAGFTPRMVQLLDYYLAYTRDVDWEEGSRPIVFQSLARTSLDLGVSERQVQHLEARLFEAGAITWSDSGNHKRYGQRDADTGRLLYAFGVDLTPLSHLRGVLEERLQEKRLYDDAWLETKRQISWYRRQIRSLLLERETTEGATAEYERCYYAIAGRVRTHQSLAELRSLLAEHKALSEELFALVVEDAVDQPQEAASGDEENFVHKETTTQESFDESNTRSPAGVGFQKSVAEHPAPKPRRPERGAEPGEAGGGGDLPGSGAEHLTLGQVLQAASPRFWEHLPLDARPMNWADVVEAADRLRSRLGVSQTVWGRACAELGRVGAALCVLVTDQAMQRAEGAVRNPAAYFAGLLRKHRTGELRLHGSVYGLTQRAEELTAAPKV